MQIIPLPLSGLYKIILTPHVDSRGHFARMFCAQVFAQQDLVHNFLQISSSFNTKSGQVRGMHYQEAPFEETKLVRCVKGAVLDVAVDIRTNSPTYGAWHAELLSADNMSMLYIPKGFAHGYKTLKNNTELVYLIDEYYNPASSRELEPLDKYWKL
jgi:dTDP-4-dehydrorhamnose 3,5-epimerase